MGRPQVDWHGSFAVIVTPFAANGDLDETAYRRVVDLVLEAGCHGLITAGSTGEFFLMTAEERKRVFEIAVDQAAGRVPVLAGPAATRTEEVVDFARHAEKVGCDGLLLLPPVYASPGERELEEFYRRVAGESGLPVMLYNSPRYVNVTLEARFVAHLMSRIDGIVAIKDTSFDIYPVSDLIRACGPELKVFVGLEDLLLPGVALGAAGAVAMLPQVVGPMAVALYEAARAGDYARARPLHNRMARAYDILSAAGNAYVAIKEAMNLLGKPGGHTRPPMMDFDEGQREILRAILRDIGLLDAEDRPVAAQ